ncbi:MAG: phosphatidylglycerophosphatase A family protein, partial [Pirellulales bacterium]
MQTNQAGERSWGGVVATFLATGFGVGFFPFAPGTLGAVWGLPLAWALVHWPAVAQAAAIVALFAVSVPVCTIAARHMGGAKDPGAIVLDEIASLPLVFLALPIEAWGWKLALAGFMLHRLFDITKPPPARQLERLPEGLGIMADDFAAAVYAALALRVVL